jgi:hypothetical protein
MELASAVRLSSDDAGSGVRRTALSDTLRGIAGRLR